MARWRRVATAAVRCDVSVAVGDFAAEGVVVVATAF